MSLLVNDPAICVALNIIMAEMAHNSARPYPMSHLRRTALMVEEAGEALKEALNATRDSLLQEEGRTTAPRRYSESAFLMSLRRELVQTAAMALRQLIEMERENGRG